MSEQSTPTLAVKNVKVAASLSEETLAFTATLYVDGKRAANVSNRGHGAGNDYHPVGGEGRALLRKAEEHAKVAEPEFGSLDILVDSLIQEYEHQKWLKRHARNATLFRLPGDEEGSVRTVKANKAWPAYAENTIKAIKDKYPGAEIIRPD